MCLGEVVQATSQSNFTQYLEQAGTCNSCVIEILPTSMKRFVFAVCNCNPAGAKEIPGYPLGGCGIVTVGLLCECKEQVQGRICDQCKPGYWNLDRNNPFGCEGKSLRVPCVNVR